VKEFLSKMQRNLSGMSPMLWLLLIILLAFSARTARCFLSDRIDKDAVLYVEMAREWADNGIEHAFDRNPRIPPLYIGLMAASEKIGIGAETGGRIVSVLTGALLPLAVFLMASSLFASPSLPLLAAFFAAIHPFLIRMSADVMRDSLFVTLSCFTVAFVLMALSGMKFWPWLFAGIFAALGIMTRSEGCQIIIALGAWICIELLFFVGRENLPWKKYLAGSFAFLIIFFGITFSAQALFKENPSSWKVIDSRYYGYVERFLFSSSKDIPDKRRDH